jgi:hypothetical protein
VDKDHDGHLDSAIHFDTSNSVTVLGLLGYPQPTSFFFRARALAN